MHKHYNGVIMSAMASQITGVSIVNSTICSGVDQRKHQGSASLAFVRGIHRSLVNSPHKGPVTRKMFPFDDIIMACEVLVSDICWSSQVGVDDHDCWVRDAYGIYFAIVFVFPIWYIVVTCNHGYDTTFVWIISTKILRPQSSTHHDCINVFWDIELCVSYIARYDTMSPN